MHDPIDSRLRGTTAFTTLSSRFATTDSREARDHQRQLPLPDERAAIFQRNGKVIEKLGGDVAFFPGPQVGFPRERLVAVRMRRVASVGSNVDLARFPTLVGDLGHASAN